MNLFTTIRIISTIGLNDIDSEGMGLATKSLSHIQLYDGAGGGLAQPTGDGDCV